MPRYIPSLWPAIAFAPIATELVIPAAPLALKPIYVLQRPVVLSTPASVPTNVFRSPFVVFVPAKTPMKALFEPSIFALPEDVLKKALLPPVKFESLANAPKNELLPPPVFSHPAERPKNELATPVVFAGPALSQKASRIAHQIINETASQPVGRGKDSNRQSLGANICTYANIEARKQQALK